MDYVVFHKDDPQIVKFYQTRSIARSIATKKNKAAGYRPLFTFNTGADVMKTWITTRAMARIRSNHGFR